MIESVETRLLRIIETVFKVSSDNVDDDFSIDNVETWDSLAHLNLVLLIEQEFGVSFTEEETVEILSFKLIKLTLRDHGVEI
jgi:acyl carrier protein